MAAANSASDPVDQYLQRCSGTPVIQAAMLGAKGVGKENIIARLGHDATIADDAFDPFGELDFSLQTVVAGRKIDIDGVKCEPSLTLSAADYDPDYSSEYLNLRHCEAVFFVYDVGSRASFEAVQHYYRNFLLERSLERSNLCIFLCRPSCPPRPEYRGMVFIVANKTDREEGEWEVGIEECRRFCESVGGDFHAMSAKTDRGTGRERLAEMTRQILLRRVENESLVQLPAAHAADGFVLPRVDKILQNHNQKFWY